PVPTHVFIGGSAGNLREIIQTAIYKNPEVRIVATAVTLEGISELTACMREFPFVWTETVMLTVSRDRKVSDYHLLSGQNPISIFSFQAGGESI
ncbi:MAG: bifunctional cobalt-precorrin-7 (C(5))-methyltransferase/cobalt-precorrin-6B (C(15))-methyltransferase, partial [Eubacteriales bacterium]|nr:bifunctional cobalt-precorrin-7 (C(5))-methyltransferase/cobalt-precorrin-6B (C(15))-methyltransferase [Eubacteriales bacterium]